MRRLCYLLIGLFIVLAVITGSDVLSSTELGPALIELASTIKLVFINLANIDFAWHSWLYSQFNDSLRAVLGAIMCLKLLLIWWGLYALHMIYRIRRRFM